MSLERTIYDLDIEKFISNFFSPYSVKDSLDYMVKELITLKRGEELQAQREAVQELLHKPHLRQTVEEFVKWDYNLKPFEGLLSGGTRIFGRIFTRLSRKDLKEAIRTDYQILRNYLNAIEKTQEIESDSSLLRELKEFGSSISQSEHYQTAKNMVETMENFGEAKLHVRYDYFDTVKGVHHIKFDPSERWKEMLDWYLHTAKVGIDYLLSFGWAYLFPSHRELLYAEALDFLVEQNLDSIQGIIGYRKKMDFFLGATRYAEKVGSKGVPLILPSFNREEGFLIKELYNPCLFLQQGISGKKNIVPNNVEASPEKNVTIITGPNNTGKTIYVKAIGLAYALAQNGFPIPALDAQLSEFDGLYTHFIHPEDITLGEGSFLDEIRRIKECYKNATKKSLLIVDEPIRGTSPEDTIELTLRFIKGFIELGAPTFLTTHLHSVSKEVDGWEGIRNLQTEIDISGTMIKPTYRVMPGRAEKSYGVRLADAFGLTEKDISDMVKKN